MKVTRVNNQTTPPTVTGTRVAVHPNVAYGVYESCMWVETNGVLIKDLYKSATDFFNFFGSFDPELKMDFVFEEYSSSKISSDI